MNHHPPWHPGAHQPHSVSRHAAESTERNGAGAVWAWLHQTLSPGRFLTLTLMTAGSLFGLIWLWVVAMPMAFLDPEYPAWRARQMLLANCDPGILILGDSRAAAGIMTARWG